MTLAGLLSDTMGALHPPRPLPPGVNPEDLKERHMVMSISPSAASFVDKTGTQKIFAALEILGINGLGDPTRNIMLFDPEAVIELGKMLVLMGRNLVKAEEIPEDIPTFSNHAYL